jgi:hypothetical protein
MLQIGANFLKVSLSEPRIERFIKMPFHLQHLQQNRGQTENKRPSKSPTRCRDDGISGFAEKK